MPRRIRKVGATATTNDRIDPGLIGLLVAICFLALLVVVVVTQGVGYQPRGDMPHRTPNGNLSKFSWARNVLSRSKEKRERRVPFSSKDAKERSQERIKTRIKKEHALASARKGLLHGAAAKNRTKRNIKNPYMVYPLNSEVMPSTCPYEMTPNDDFEAIDKIAGGRVEIDLSDMESLFLAHTEKLEWLRVYNGRVYRPGEELLGDYPLSNYAACLCMAVERMKQMELDIPNGDYLFSVTDGPFCFGHRHCKVPVLAHNSRIGTDFAVRIPWPPYMTIFQKVWSRVEDKEFQEKKFIGEWRGRLTGLGAAGEHVEDPSQMDLQDFPRFLLVVAGEQHPELLDAKFIGWPQENNHLYKMETRKDFLAHFRGTSMKHTRLDRKTQANYAFTVIVDGNYGQGRLPYQMGMNTVIFRMKSDWPDYYEQWMEDGVHFVSFETIDELLEKIAHFQEEKEKAEEIAQNGRDFALKCLNSESFLRYLSLALKEYSSRLVDEIEEPTFDPMPINTTKKSTPCLCPNHFDGW